MNKFLIALLICCSFLAQSKSWNHVLSQTQNLLFSPDFPNIEPPLVIENKIVFKGLSNYMFGLWSYDTQTNELTSLIPPNENTSVKHFVNTGSEVYFLYRETEYGYGRIWITDGTLSGTNEFLNEDIIISGDKLNPSLVIKNGVILARGANGAIVEYSDNQVTVHDIELYDPFLSKLCVFGHQNFVTYDFWENKQIAYVNGSNNIDLSGALPESYYIKSMVEINNSCYIHFSEGYSNNATIEVLQVSPSGESTIFSEDESLQDIYQVFEHNNQKYAFRKNLDENNSSSIVTLTVEDEIENTVFTLPKGKFVEFLSTKGSLQVSFDGDQTALYVHYLMDEYGDFQTTRSGTYLDLPKHYPSLDSDTLVMTRDEISNTIELDVIGSNGDQNNFNSNGFDFIDAISSNTSNNIYFMLRDKETGLKSIYALDELPDIGASLNGIWHDPNLKNQGLFIKQGKRNDSSSYISVTMYTYKNGQPFWLAGNVDYSPGQATIEIDLFDYRGAEFLELVEEPERNAFGKVEITPTSCDTIQIQLTKEGSVNEFNFGRINNTTFEKYCLVQTDL